MYVSEEEGIGFIGTFPEIFHHGRIGFKRTGQADIFPYCEEGIRSQVGFEAIPCPAAGSEHFMKGQSRGTMQASLGKQHLFHSPYPVFSGKPEEADECGLFDFLGHTQK